MSLLHSRGMCVSASLKHSLERRMLLVSRNTAAAASRHHFSLPRSDLTSGVKLGQGSGSKSV